MQQLFGLIGFPVEHSASPAMMNAAFANDGKSAIYLPFATEPHQLREKLASLSARSAVGVNVTIPHKTQAFDWVSQHTAEAQLVGAVNTIRFDAVNGATGHNTDVKGWWASVEPSITSLGKVALQIAIIGSGGASMAILAAISLYAPAAHVTLIARNLEKAQALISRFQGLFNVRMVDWDSRNEAISSAQLVVNTTPMGMWPKIDESPVSDESVFHVGQIVQDIVYRPEQTLFLEKAQRNGCTVVGGLGMLIYQGAAAYEWWFGHCAPVDVMWEAARRHLSTRSG